MVSNLFVVASIDRQPVGADQEMTPLQRVVRLSP